MRIAMLLAFCLFAGQAVAELFPLPEDWLRKPVPVEVEPTKRNPSLSNVCRSVVARGGWAQRRRTICQNRKCRPATTS